MCMLRAAGLLYSLLQTLQLWLVAVLGAGGSIMVAGVSCSGLMDRSSGSLCSVAGAQPGQGLAVLGEGEDRARAGRGGV